MGESGGKNLDDLSHERAVWKVEHWGWVLFGLVLVASVVGLFGEGPIAHRKIAGPQVLVEYDRFARYQSRTKLKIQIAPSAGGSLPAVWLSKRFIERVELDQFTPPAERVKVAQDSLVYIFDVADTNQQATLTLEYKPASYGNTPIKLGLLNGPEVQFTQFFYP
ncbi:MAG TPA: hypothetical protein VJ063_18870 [Verrucomicrobiae bacterium]|nr:hypothetical protein [Verrucomicrobiae bacterium]